MGGVGRLTTDWPETLIREEAEDFTGGSGLAVFNETRTHRYLLERRWRTGKLLTWIMLNPSTADAFDDDPTIRRCINFAKRDGYAGIKVVNLFALRTPDPHKLQTHPDPIGACNDRMLREATQDEIAVAAWGAGGKLRDRGRTVIARLTAYDVAMVCLAVTKDGQPVHPLARGRSRVPDDAPFTPWKCAA